MNDVEHDKTRRDDRAGLQQHPVEAVLARAIVTPWIDRRIGDRWRRLHVFFLFFFQAEDGIRDYKVTGVQTCALPISSLSAATPTPAMRWLYIWYHWISNASPGLALPLRETSEYHSP